MEKSTFLKRMSPISITLIIVLLLTVIIGEITRINIANGFIFLLSPILIFIILFFAGDILEKDIFIVIVGFISTQILYFIIYNFVYVIENSRPIYSTIIGFALFLISFTIALIILIRNTNIRKGFRKPYLILYSLVNYIISILLLWNLAWAGVV